MSPLTLIASTKSQTQGRTRQFTLFDFNTICDNATYIDNSWDKADISLNSSGYCWKKY